ncbi:MAG: phosphate ABC transporter substrate-binding protein [Firmicutes bacterium]|nr:phosphate ABC transporter substrate-binding protein [Bacillota bacterium]
MKKSLSLLLVLSLLASLLFVGCKKTNNEETKENEEKVATESILFKGSSTLAPVITKLTENFTKEYKTWDKVDSKFASEEIDIAISGGGSGAGVKSAIDKSSSFGMASRPVSDEEKGKIDGYKEFKLGTDALTVSVNPENKLYEVKKSITTEELRKIFSGEYKYWDEVSDKLDHEKIVLVTRDLGGGAHKVFNKKVMGDVEVSENVIQSPSMGALVTKIIENKNAIGYASFGVVNQNKGKVMPLNIDGIEPTAENIISGDYKISRPLLVITGGELSECEKALIDYITSEKGMKVVKELGFVAEK